MDAITAYIEGFPEKVKERLKAIRALIQGIVPEAEEKISYGMPTFFLKGNLVHYAGFSKHIGFYPTPSGITAFEEELKPYKFAKGSIQFPLDQELPLDLIEKIVRFRVAEQLAKQP